MFEMSPYQISHHMLIHNISLVISIIPKTKYRFHAVAILFLDIVQKSNLTPLSRTLLDKLKLTRLDKKFPVFCGTRRFIEVFTSVRN